jgi:5,10-methylenetetrahydromethanopterin reductase
MAQAGPRAAVMLHRAADEALAGLKPGTPMPTQRAEIEGYIALARGFDPETRYLENHRGHLMVVKPEERGFITADLIRATTFTATEAEVRGHIGALGDAGYTQFVICLMPGQEAALADWARVRQGFA